MKKVLSGLCLSLVLILVGCASGVKLNEVPVEDKSSSLVKADAVNALSSKSVVTSVQTSALGAMNMGPAGIEKVVYFDYDSYAIKPEAQATVESHAKFLSADKSRKVALEGHTDDRGGREYNLALGQKRSEAVKRSLTLLGVSEAQIEAVSLGKETPAASGSDESTYAKNRRVEFNYK
ncbi:MAG: peptidoglycan-associated lipoprotein Pal [Burkholderiaceae bacterium]|jgi:peptidoglycan-associated lipoprotein